MEYITSNGSKYHLLQTDVEKAKPIQINGMKRYLSHDPLLTEFSIDDKHSKSFIEENRGKDDLDSEIRKSSDSIFNEFLLNDVSHTKNQGIFGNMKKTKERNTASNFDTLHRTQNDDFQKEIFDSWLSKCKSIPSNIPVSGASGFHISKKASNAYVKNSQSDSSLDKNESTCKLCKRKISDHIFEKEGRNLYKCCACNYRNANKCNLHLHASHTSCQSLALLACDICDELMRQKEYHGNEQTCDLCGLKFQCKTLLEQHSLDHEGFYGDYCRVCKKEISEHIGYGENSHFYMCCKCGLVCSEEHNLKKHLYIHTGLKIFKCDFCDKRFSQRSRVGTHSLEHIICDICERRFSKIERLEAHYLNEHCTTAPKWIP